MRSLEHGGEAGQLAVARGDQAEDLHEATDMHDSEAQVAPVRVG